ncbi:hypothetical protein HanRHA438_Chr13g0617811 [Helianthus annuus]|nr:hypothetical protein HanRHA438_Chr13g0617811 [Helianthus annuus]
MIEDGLCVLLDVDDTSCLLQSTQPQDGGNMLLGPYAPGAFGTSAACYRVARPPLVHGLYSPDAYGLIFSSGMVPLLNWSPYSDEYFSYHGMVDSARS